MKLRFFIRGGIPEPEKSHHQTGLPLWQRRNVIQLEIRRDVRVAGGRVVHRARR